MSSHTSRPRSSSSGPRRVPRLFQRSVSECSSSRLQQQQQSSRDSSDTPPPHAVSGHSSPVGSPGSTWSLPALPHAPHLSSRRRGSDCVEAMLSSSPPAAMARIFRLPFQGSIPRDSLQPKSGSLAGTTLYLPFCKYIFTTPV